MSFAALAIVLSAGPVSADELVVAPDEIAPILARLKGHQASVVAGSIRIDDIAGEGAPRIGVVERDGEHLVLVAGDERWRLTGPLARPRIAGPGYTVWVIGEITHHNVPTLKARRLGILRRPGP